MSLLLQVLPNLQHSILPNLTESLSYYESMKVSLSNKEEEGDGKGKKERRKWVCLRQREA